MFDYAAARHHMVESQIRTADVTDPHVVRAFRMIPREIFVPRSKKSLAYADIHVELEDGGYVLSPRDFAKMVLSADIKHTDVVLDIGCGRGYSTAILAQLADTVVGIERTVELAERASTLLTDNNISNAAVLDGDYKTGAPQHGPFDVIFVNGAVQFIPDGWISQLSNAGRIVTVYHDGEVGRASVYARAGNGLSQRTVFDSSAPILPGFMRDVEFAL